MIDPPPTPPAEVKDLLRRHDLPALQRVEQEARAAAPAADARAVLDDPSGGRSTAPPDL